MGSGASKPTTPAPNRTASVKSTQQPQSILKNSKTSVRQAPAKGFERKESGAIRISKAREESNDKETDEFHNICMSVFQNADRDNDGVLSPQEFFNVMSSPTLGLNLSNDEIKEVHKLADADGDGTISYKEFVPILKRMLQMVYQRSNLDWNDWCTIGMDKVGKQLYLNKRTGQITTTKPENFNSERKEVSTFQYITLEDGTEITTMVDGAGKRTYLDWETEVRESVAYCIVAHDLDSNGNLFLRNGSTISSTPFQTT